MCVVNLILRMAVNEMCVVLWLLYATIENLYSPSMVENNKYSASQKIPPEVLWQFFQNGWEFSDQILHAYYAFLSTLECDFFIELSATLTKLCHIKRDHPVHTICWKCPPSAETHAAIFWYFSETVKNF